MSWLSWYVLTPLDIWASTAGMIALMIGVPTTMFLLAVVLVVAGVEIPDKPEGPAWVMFFVATLILMFGLPLFLSSWVSRRVYRRYTLPCRHCGKQPLSRLKNQRRELTGRCPFCDRSMFTQPGEIREEDTVANS